MQARDSEKQSSIISFIVINSKNIKNLQDWNFLVDCLRI